MTKYLISLLAVATSVAACATAVESENTFGVLKVPVPTTQVNTVICVPWVDLGSSDGQITVTNLVLASNLAAGDSLIWWNGSEYMGWLCTGEGASKYWKPSTVSGLRADIPAASANQTIGRGTAIIVHQTGTPTDIYLYGQYLSTPASVTVTAGTSDTPKYTLMAPTSAAEIDLNSISWVMNDGGTPRTPSTDDFIITSAGTNYNWRIVDTVGKWQRLAPTGTSTTYPGTNITVPNKAWTEAGVVIPKGQGVWYVSKGGNPKITW